MHSLKQTSRSGRGAKRDPSQCSGCPAEMCLEEGAAVYDECGQARLREVELSRVRLNILESTCWTG